MLILATCYSSIQRYFKSNLDLTTLFNVYFLHENLEPFDKELHKAGQE